MFAFRDGSFGGVWPGCSDYLIDPLNVGRRAIPQQERRAPVDHSDQFALGVATSRVTRAARISVGFAVDSAEFCRAGAPLALFRTWKTGQGLDHPATGFRDRRV